MYLKVKTPVRSCLLLLLFVFHGFVYEIICGFRIDFQQNCENPQVQLIPCPESLKAAVVSPWPPRRLGPPTFKVGSAWHNATQLIGNFSFHFGRRQVQLLAVDLVLHGLVQDRRCLHVLQLLVTQRLTLHCLRMVPDNFAEISVKLYQNTRVCRNQTAGNCFRLQQRATYTFNIGQESCRYYNQKVAIDAVGRFTGWKGNAHSTVEFVYFDSSVNVYANVTEVIITEPCPDHVYVAYTKTIERGANTIRIQDNFVMKCPQKGRKEIVAETCSYCHGMHDHTECFHQDIRWIEGAKLRNPCDECSMNAACVDGQCLCNSGYEGNGHSCLQTLHIKEGKFPTEVLFVAAACTAGIVLIIVLLKRTTLLKVTCKKLKETFSNDGALEQRDILLQNHTSSTPSVKPKQILALYHLDSESHKHNIDTLFSRLTHDHTISVLGRPQDYTANWVTFARDAVQRVDDVLVVLSQNLCELCDLYARRDSRTSMEEDRWIYLLERRLYECVPCHVMNNLQNMFQSGSKEDLPRIHLVEFLNEQDGDKNVSSKSGNLFDQFISNFGFLRNQYHVGRVKHVSINTADLQSDSPAIRTLVSQFKTLSR